jgi:hypothetical protein
MARYNVPLDVFNLGCHLDPKMADRAWFVKGKCSTLANMKAETRSGRKRRPRELTERLGLRVSPGLRDALERYAREDGRSLSSFSVRVLERYVAERETQPLREALEGGAIDLETYVAERRRRAGEESGQ